MRTFSTIVPRRTCHANKYIRQKKKKIKEVVCVPTGPVVFR